jgi:DNA-binding Lrp family transcriptional regulator
MRNYKPDKKAYDITILACSGDTQIQIAKELNMTESAVSQRINTLQKYGYLIKNKSGVINTFGLAPLGIALVTEMARRGMQPLCKTDFESNEQFVRIHNVEARYDVKTSLRPSKPPLVLSTAKIEYKLVGLKNHSSVLFVHKKHTVMLTPTSLIVYGQDIVGKSTELNELYLEALDAADSIALDLEAKLGIKLKRLDKNTLIKHLIKLHIALIDNPIAKLINDNDGNMYENNSSNC